MTPAQNNWWCMGSVAVAVLYIGYIILFAGGDYRITSYGTDIHHVKSIWERLSP